MPASFHKSTLFIIVFVMMIPISLIAQNFSGDELIGKGNPELFGEGIGLRKEAYEAFLKMKAAAKKEGINIKVVSGYRNFDRQKAIYESKYRRFTNSGLSPEKSIRKIIEYSTIPGTSRHHWGTDIDVIDDNGKYSGDVLIADKFHGNGPFCKFKEWMDLHANSFGFYLVYTDNANRKGFEYEPWHYSYRALSKQMLTEYIKIDIKKVLFDEQLLGKEYLDDEFINTYHRDHILGINPELY
ncbi:D-alanyl-D-alanine carboxypeptidase family protein [Flavobacteriaceae bacterium R38]|nr:D-alanyl-D-alanine carboxypeptidase family protein [Flavobacteriaceae bacterium R38]